MAEESPPYPQSAAAVDDSCFFHIFRYAGKELPQKEDVERTSEKARHRQGQQCIIPAEPPEQDECGNQGNLSRQHHGGEQDHKQDRASWSSKPGKAVSHKRAGQGHPDHSSQDCNHGVLKESLHRQHIKRPPVIAQDSGSGHQTSGSHTWNSFLKDVEIIHRRES